MKTNEFIKSLEDLGFKTNKSNDSVRDVVYVTKPKDASGKGGRVAIVSVNKEYECSTRWASYGQLSSILKANLYGLIKDYIETPLELRWNIHIIWT